MNHKQPIRRFLLPLSLLIALLVLLLPTSGTQASTALFPVGEDSDGASLANPAPMINSSAILTDTSLVDEPLIVPVQPLGTGRVRLSAHSETRKIRFLAAQEGFSLPQPTSLPADASPEEAARNFLTAYGRDLGVANQANELTLKREKVLDRGRSVVRFQQETQGVPVLGGELNMQMDSVGSVLSVNGEMLPDLNTFDATPSIFAARAAQTALAKVAKKYQMNMTDLAVTLGELWIYNPAILAPFSTFVPKIQILVKKESNGQK